MKKMYIFGGAIIMYILILYFVKFYDDDAQHHRQEEEEPTQDSLTDAQERSPLLVVEDAQDPSSPQSNSVRQRGPLFDGWDMV